MRLRQFWRLAAMAAAIAGGSLGGAKAQTAGFDFHGRIIRLLVGQAAGGVTDLEARLLARYLAEDLPGAPDIVIQNITGAGGLRMLAYFAGLNPAELAVAVVPSTVPFRARSGRLEVPFDPRAVAWIGSFADSTVVCLTGTASGVATLEDMRAREVRFGLLSAGGANDAIRLVLNHALGLRLVGISGYESLATLSLALARGEIDGLCSPYSSYPTLLAPMVAAGTAQVVLYLGPERIAGIPAPYLFDLPMAPEALAFLQGAIASISFARPLAVAAGADPAFVQAMRDGFAAVMANPDFHADAAAAGIVVHPMLADRLAAETDALYTLPDEMVLAIDAYLFAE